VEASRDAAQGEAGVGASCDAQEARGVRTPRDAAPEKARAQLLREASLELLALHTSTRERLPVMERFYAHIARFAPRASHVLDIGCGFAPFALPLMDMAEGAIYDAWDLSFATVELINRFFAVCGKPPGARVGDAQGLLGERFAQAKWAGGARKAADAAREHAGAAAGESAGAVAGECAGAAAGERAGAAAGGPVDTAGTADLALMLKLLPVLEQQRKGLAFELIDMAPARLVAVSFPTKSLGGRGKSMAGFYSRMFETGLSDTSRILDKSVIGDELLYMVAGRAQ